ncbi:DegT/DnrJ/EryC1/StrS family aminotransferase, partial [bacterium]|nr:DegT/DnrJ/EryC1/StrS family aminotransferase [bacterium]
VLIPAITFVATATAALYNQLEPVFVDVDRETLSMDLDDLQKKITSDCVAVMPVHLGGHPVQMDHLLEIARQHNLKVIEDCAHCAGGAYQGRKLGTWGDIGCFSFEEKKCMITGDGGMLSANAPEIIEKLRPYRWIGIDKDTWKRAAGYTVSDANARHWYYEVSVLGFKYNMNDLMAAIGLAQLKKLDWMNDRRRHIIKRYLDGIKNMKKISPLFPYQLKDGAYWLFGVRCDHRDALIIHLKQRGIATGVHYMPVPLHPLFREYQGKTPVANEVWETMITLPLFPDLSDEEVDYIVDALWDFEKNKDFHADG